MFCKMETTRSRYFLYLASPSADALLGHALLCTMLKNRSCGHDRCLARRRVGTVNTLVVKFDDTQPENHCCISTFRAHVGGVSSLVELSDGGVASGGHDRKLIAWGGTSLGVTNAALGGGGGGGGGGGNGGSG
eukprot:gene22771-25335_t